MNKTTEENIRKELKPYAVFYDRIIGENPTEKSIRWTSEKCDRLLRGRWPGHRTRTYEIWIRRGDNSRLRLLIAVNKNHRQGIHEKDTGVLWIHGGGYAVGVPEIDFMFADAFCAIGL